MWRKKKYYDDYDDDYDDYFNADENKIKRDFMNYADSKTKKNKRRWL